MQREELPAAFWPAQTAQAHRVVHAGLGYHGGPRDVTGMVLVPDVPVPAEGLPIVGCVHGTTEHVLPLVA